jgi:hypothetical protein
MSDLANAVLTVWLPVLAMLLVAAFFVRKQK